MFEETDTLYYVGDINSVLFDQVVGQTETPKSSKCCFILQTPGGCPHTAFKIARRLQNKYDHFTLHVHRYCKSAGTLIALGSDCIMMGDTAELGPLDVQLREKDEIWGSSSGLNLSTSLRTLETQAMGFLRDALLIFTKINLSTKTAAELATKLAIGFVEPIISKIDPIKLGKIERAVKIAMEYGLKLISLERGNIEKENAFQKLTHLILGYPDHGFVIDYVEALSIFKNVTPEIEKIKQIVTFFDNDDNFPVNQVHKLDNKVKVEETTNDIQRRTIQNSPRETKRKRQQNKREPSQKPMEACTSPT